MDIIAYTVICSFSSFLLGMAVAFPFVVARRARRAFEQSLKES